ncbi:MAG: hypothetical protein WA821_00580 [Anaerolineales bacterium]
MIFSCEISTGIMDKRWKVYLNLAEKNRNARGTFSWRVWANAKGRWHACGPGLFDVVPVGLRLRHKPSFLAWMGWAQGHGGDALELFGPLLQGFDRRVAVGGGLDGVFADGFLGIV